MSNEQLEKINTANTSNESHSLVKMEKSKRIIMFCDLRDSTEILLDFEQGVYQNIESSGEDKEWGYDKFLLDVHKTTFKSLYLCHDHTHTEIYGDGLMAIFPEDNSKYILENIYTLTCRMRNYNDSEEVGTSKPCINLGFGITVADIELVYYDLDKRYHPIGLGVHEAARIEGMSKFYDARVLISDKFFTNIVDYINADPRFSYRFIDRVRLKNFRSPITLYEILVNNDPRFEDKINSIELYSAAYNKYCQAKWISAKKLFMKVFHEFGLGTGLVMAKRCSILAQKPAKPNWNGVWKLKDK